MKKKRIVNTELINKVREDFCSVCGTPFNIVVHHLKTRGAGGDDVISNLTALCVYHHDEIHRDGMTKFIKKHPIFKEILVSKGWYFDKTLNKWRMLN